MMFNLPRPHIWTRWETRQKELRDTYVQDTSEYAQEDTLLSQYRQRATINNILFSATVALYFVSALFLLTTLMQDTLTSRVTTIVLLIAATVTMIAYRSMKHTVETLVTDLNTATEQVLEVFRARLKADIFDTYGEQVVVYSNGDVSAVRNGTKNPAEVWHDGHQVQVELFVEPERLQSVDQ